MGVKVSKSQSNNTYVLKYLSGNYICYLPRNTIILAPHLQIDSIYKHTLSVIFTG